MKLSLEKTQNGAWLSIGTQDASDPLASSPSPSSTIIKAHRGLGRRLNSGDKAAEAQTQQSSSVF